MSAVFPGVSKAMNDKVVGFLAGHQGATTDEIMYATGRSRNGVLRVLKQNPLISEVEVKGKAKAWRIDLEAATDGIRYIPIRAERDNRFEASAARSVNALSQTEFDEAIATLQRATNRLAERLELLRESRHTAISIQHGRMGDTDAAFLLWTRALGEIEKVKILGLTLDMFTDKYVNDPRARTNEWWALFPKEQNNGNQPAAEA